jgi:hypothetical protein
MQRCLLWVNSTHYRAAALLSASPQSTDISARGDPAGAFGRLAKRRERLDSCQCTAPTRALGTIDEGVG